MTRLSNLTVSFPAVISLVALAHAAPAPAAAPTSECILLIGGGGTVTADKDTNERWFILNSAVSRFLASALTKRGYRVQELISDIQGEDTRATALQQAVYKTGCSQVLRLTDELTSSKDHPGTVSKFDFVVSVLRLESLPPPSKAYTWAVRIAEKYEMAYEYDMKPDTIEKLSFSGLADSMAADVDKAHVLDK